MAIGVVSLNGAFRPVGTERNFSDLTVGTSELKLPFGGHATLVQKGYGIDLDGDGQFRGDRDGVLAFDINKDGRVDQQEIGESRRRLNLMGGRDPDLQDPCKRHKAEAERNQLLQQYDRDGDGKLNDYELQAAGGRVLVDSNRDGTFSPNEAQSVDRIHTRSGLFQLNQVDPRGNYSDVSRGWGWSCPPGPPRWGW